MCLFMIRWRLSCLYTRNLYVQTMHIRKNLPDDSRKCRL